MGLMAKTIKINTANLIEKLVPVLLLATIGLSFLVGTLWQKVKNLEGGGVVNTGGNAAPAAQGPKLADADLKKFAKDLKLDTNKFNSCLDKGNYASVVSGDLAQGEQIGVTGTPAFFLNGHLIQGAQPYSVFKEAIEYELAGGDWSKAPTTLTGSVAPAKVDVNIDGAYSKGSNDAKVTIVEFSDFQCPYCARFYSETLGQIIKDYVDTGKVRFVYKHFPLISIHPLAQKAGEAAACAGEQGKFWEMHDLMFDSHGY